MPELLELLERVSESDLKEISRPRAELIRLLKNIAEEEGVVE